MTQTTGKNVANLKDAFYTLSVSTDGRDYKKIEHLQKCSMPAEEKVLDEVTATDDTQTINAPVNFFEAGEVEFEIVLDPDNETHKALQKAFDSSSELHWKIEFVKAASESRKFKGIISKYSLDNEDTKKKVRKMGTISITSTIEKVNSD